LSEVNETNSDVIVSNYLWSKWHDYDFIYTLNDNLIDTNACPDDQQFYQEWAQDLSECKKSIFK